MKNKINQQFKKSYDRTFKLLDVFYTFLVLCILFDVVSYEYSQYLVEDYNYSHGSFRYKLAYMCYLKFP
uniref:Lipoprotein signal peptidase n=1 Tax=Heterorhabditis bacteriophora TaxID=37862 RepID=A0A1I7W6P4_HETBA